jgi:iron complex outermembrane receptor protein
VGGDLHTSYSFINPLNSASNWGTRATLIGDIGGITLTSISAYRGVTSNTPNDQAGIPYPAVILNGALDHQHQFSQELLATGDALDGKLNLTGGLYYFDEVGDSSFADYFLVPLIASGQSAKTVNENSAAGAFTQATYEILPKLRATAGIRYTRDDRSDVIHSHIFNEPNDVAAAFVACYLPASLLADPVNCATPRRTLKNSYEPFTVGLDYKVTDDSLLYGKVSRGYRAGGFSEVNGLDATIFAPYNPEKLTSYEIGEKTEWLDHRLRVNADVYYSDYKGVQEFVTLPSAFGPETWTKNWGDASILGGELEATTLIEKLTLSGGVGVLNAEWKNGPFATGNALLEPDQPYFLTPKVTFNLGADYPLNLKELGVLNLHADYNYRSKIFYGPRAVSDPASWPFEAQNGYGLLNARVALDLHNLPVTIALWGKNLTNKQYYTAKADFVVSGLGGVAGYVGDPRVVGASITYRFGE